MLQTRSPHAAARLLRRARLFSTAVEKPANSFDISGQALLGRAVYLDAQVRARVRTAASSVRHRAHPPPLLTPRIATDLRPAVRSPRHSSTRACSTPCCRT